MLKKKNQTESVNSVHSDFLYKTLFLHNKQPKLTDFGG